MAKRKHVPETADDRGNNQPWQADDSAAADELVATHEVRLAPELAPIEHVAEISVPLSSELPTEFPIHLDVTLPPPSATTLRRIAIALDRQQARTSDGQRVVKPTQALRWLLEQAVIRSAS